MQSTKETLENGFVTIGIEMQADLVRIPGGLELTKYIKDCTLLIQGIDHAFLA